MIAMIFEYWLDEDHLEEYQQEVKLLRKRVQEIDGFISIETFMSASDPDKHLAVGFFRDEQAVQVWRNMPEHRRAQRLGRQSFFPDYRLCMAEVIRDYSKADRVQVPQDSQVIHDESSNKE